MYEKEMKLTDKRSVQDFPYLQENKVCQNYNALNQGHSRVRERDVIKLVLEFNESAFAVKDLKILKRTEERLSCSLSRMMFKG